MMEVVTGYPPNFSDIAKHFPLATRPGVIFTYGQRIFTGAGCEVCPALKAHESVHSQRQIEQGVEKWWERYLVDDAFRLEEELLAHRAEYRTLKSWTRDRNQVAQALHAIASRLSSGLYGQMMTYQKARRFIAVDVR